MVAVIQESMPVMVLVVPVAMMVVSGVMVCLLWVLLGYWGGCVCGLGAGCPGVAPCGWLGVGCCGAGAGGVSCAAGGVSCGLFCGGWVGVGR